ncbi:MAG: DinB family protein [Sphingobacteriales bacterium]|nr:MAG: DinB family protein [Sphingobacteriales bacterium]
MHPALSFARTTRLKMLAMTESLSTEALNHIPEPLSNNLAWQLGHVTVITEALMYLRGGIQPERYIVGLKQYMKGSRPEQFIPEAEITRIKTSLLSSLDELEQTLPEQALHQTLETPFVNSFIGMTYSTLDELLWFTSHHDMLHLGNMTALQKMI